METAYIFNESDHVSIALMDLDPELFKRLSAIGRWDAGKKRFILRYRQNANQYRIIFADRPFVEVKQYGQITISGFLERSWNSSLPENRQSLAGKHGRAFAPFVNKADRSCLESDIRPPEQFSSFWAEKLQEELHCRKYSPKTIKSYIHFNRDFCRVVQKPVEQITEADFKMYLSRLDIVKNLSSASMNLAISSIRFFYYYVMGKNIGREQYRPRQNKRLPRVLSREEIECLLNAEANPKHRLLLMLTYSSGLRVSEVVALKKEHVDFKHRTLKIFGAKGNKDRVTILSDRAAAFLQEYCRRYKITTWLFPGNNGKHLHIRSAQNIFEKAAHKAQIHKDASIHSLRHTFATHLLEGGTDIKYIQALLGHSSVRTTERYTHITPQKILRIQSPLDS